MRNLCRVMINWISIIALSVYAPLHVFPFSGFLLHLFHEPVGSNVVRIQDVFKGRGGGWLDSTLHGITGVLSSVVVPRYTKNLQLTLNATLHMQFAPQIIMHLIYFYHH